MGTKEKTKKGDELSFGYRLLRGAIHGVARLPLGMMYGISDFAAFIMYHVIKYRRGIVRKNLTRAFPDADIKQIVKWEKGFYRHLCDVFIEAAKLAHISDKEVEQRMVIRNYDKVNRAIEADRPVVLMLGHYGNWEWVTSINRKFVAEAHGCQIYHPLSDKNFDKLMLELRGRFGTESIPMARAVRRLFEIEKSGKHYVCGFIADQRPNGSSFHHWTDFMGIDTPYVVGGESIGDHTKAVYLYVDVEKTKRGHYVITFEDIVPPEDDKEEYPYTREYMRMLERSIRRAPQYWLWSHNRWSRTR